MYGSPTRKRHIGWSNSASIRRLDLGRLTRQHAARIAKRGVRSAKTYINRKGKKSFAGSKFLKGTGSHGLIQENPLLNLSYSFLGNPMFYIVVELQGYTFLRQECQVANRCTVSQTLL